MMTETKLGKITDCRVGYGGYDDAMIGISFSLGGESWGTCDFWGAWGTDRSDSAKWTEEDRTNSLGNAMWRLRNLLDSAKVQNTKELIDMPVEVTFEDSAIKSWRVLTEVL